MPAMWPNAIDHGAPGSRAGRKIDTGIGAAEIARSSARVFAHQNGVIGICLSADFGQLVATAGPMVAIVARRFVAVI